MKQRSSNVIVDDYTSQGYGIDSEMDAQDMDLGDAQSALFIEGDSEYGGVGDHDMSMGQIGENDDELNNSVDGKRGTFHAKRPKSAGGFDSDEEDTPDPSTMILSKNQKSHQEYNNKANKLGADVKLTTEKNQH